MRMAGGLLKVLWIAPKTSLWNHMLSRSEIVWYYSNSCSFDSLILIACWSLLSIRLASFGLVSLLGFSSIFLLKIFNQIPGRRRPIPCPAYQCRFKLSREQQAWAIEGSNLCSEKGLSRWSRQHAVSCHRLALSYYPNYLQFPMRTNCPYQVVVYIRNKSRG